MSLRARYVEALLASSLAVRERLRNATESGAVEAAAAGAADTVVLRLDSGRLRRLAAWDTWQPVPMGLPPRPRFLDGDDGVVPQWTPPPLAAETRGGAALSGVAGVEGRI